jgi:hypothetical protein
MSLDTLALPQIRTCPTKASGSSADGFTRRQCNLGQRPTVPLSRDPAGFRAPGAEPRWAPPVSPRGVHPPAAPFPPPGPRRRVPRLPRYDGAVRLPGSLAPPFVAFAWRYQAVCLSFRSQRSRAPNRGPGVGHPVPHEPERKRLETGRASQVPGESSCAYALLFDPGRTDASGHRLMPSARPPLGPRRRLPQSRCHLKSRIRKTTPDAVTRPPLATNFLERSGRRLEIGIFPLLLVPTAELAPQEAWLGWSKSRLISKMSDVRADFLKYSYLFTFLLAVLTGTSAIAR